MHTLKKLLSLTMILVITQAAHAMQNFEEENDPYEILHQGIDNLYVPSHEITCTCNIIEASPPLTNQCSTCTIKFSTDIIEHENVLLTYTCRCNSKDFLDAASANCCSCCVKFLKEGAHINQQEHRSGFTALHHAACNGNNELVKILIAQGALIDQKDRHKKTALHWAAHFDFSSIIKFLIDSGASINRKDMHKRTALHYAARGNHPESLSILLLHGANSHLQDNKGWTPLHHAVKKSYVRIIRLILDIPFLLTPLTPSQEILNSRRALIKNPKKYVERLLKITDKKDRTVFTLEKNLKPTVWLSLLPNIYRINFVEDCTNL